MGRNKENNVYTHFDVDKKTLKSKCLVCEKYLNSINGSNLLKHLKTHKKQYDEVKALNTRRAKENTKKTPNTEIVTRECTNLVAVCGRPLALLDDEPFQNILALIPDCNVKVSSRNTRHDITEAAATLRYSMAKELQNKIICIKIDIASLSLRSFMGINAQYLKEGTVALKNLAMIELLERHTSENLKEQVLFVLQRFRIGIENVYSFTTDNGANMLKMGRLFNDRTNVENEAVLPGQANESTGNASAQIAEATDADVIEDHGAECTENMSVASDSDFDYDADTEFDTDREHQFTETVTSALSMHFHSTQERNIIVIRCAAHTLQLSVIDACSSTQIKTVIDEARKISKQLRTQKYAAIIAKSGKNQAILDCPTRWNSTVDLIQRLIDLREICNNANDSNLHVPDTIWNTLHDILKSLLPAKELSKILQHEQLIMGDFYLEWLLCKIKLKSVNTTLSNLLHSCMENREQMIFANDAFLCALFLDGRANAALSENQRQDARIKLLQLHHYLQNINNDKENMPDCISTSTSSMSTSERNSARVELDEFLSVKYVEAQTDNNIQILLGVGSEQRRPSGFGDLNEEFTSFLKEPLLKSTENILKYWELNKYKYPRLYKLACVVLASPATQVSVERLFSSLKFVVSKYRLNLNRALIEDIIFIRNNKLYNKN